MHFRKIFDILFNWERWDYRIKYIPIYPFWLWYCLKARSFWFFTASNPTLTFGGFEGESKKEMYDQLPPSTYSQTFYISPSFSFNEVERIVTKNFTYPFAVKPDVGMMGFMFRKIDNIEALRAYHQKMPVNYLIQDLIKLPIEVIVFYYRFPGKDSGVISGFLKKEMPEVVGDGISTLQQLILNYPPRTGFFPAELLSKHKPHLDEVIPAGEIFRLSWAANLSRGGKLISLAHEIDDRLLKIFDDLSNYTQHFYYGRYDIKCNSIEDLKNGHFSILEFNGSGAEPHHAYGNGNTLFQAHKIFTDHWDVLYRISQSNHDKGIPYWKFGEGLEFLKKAKHHFTVLRKLDRESLNG